MYYNKNAQCSKILNYYVKQKKNNMFHLKFTYYLFIIFFFLSYLYYYNTIPALIKCVQISFSKLKLF